MKQAPAQSKQTQKSLAAGLDDFHALSGGGQAQSIPALLRVLAKLYVMNPAPQPHDTAQFEELVLQLLPFADAQTRQTLQEELSSHPHTPESVLQGLKQAPEAARNITPKIGTKPPLKMQTAKLEPQYTAKHLLGGLPLQISQRHAHAAALAACKGHSHTLRGLIAFSLKAPPLFAARLFEEKSGFLLAVALKAMRMPRASAEPIFRFFVHRGELAKTGPEQLLAHFERLNAESCRRKIAAELKAFFAQEAPSHARTGLKNHVPDITKPDLKAPAWQRPAHTSQAQPCKVAGA